MVGDLSSFLQFDSGQQRLQYSLSGGSTPKEGSYSATVSIVDTLTGETLKTESLMFLVYVEELVEPFVPEFII